MILLFALACLVIAACLIVWELFADVETKVRDFENRTITADPHEHSSDGSTCSCWLWLDAEERTPS